MTYESGPCLLLSLYAGVTLDTDINDFNNIPILLYTVYVTRIVGSVCSGNTPRLHVSNTIVSPSTVLNDISIHNGIVELDISPHNTRLASAKTSGRSWTAKLNC